nr:spore germination protein [Cohnella faecalis]
MAEDIHFNYAYVSFARVVRGASLFISLFLPGIWVALLAFHQDQIPFRLMATISVARLGLPMSVQMEMFLLLMLLEVFREAGVRLPSSIGQTLTSIGGLIIGDAAIRAGLVSPSIVVVGAITAVSGVTLVNQSLSTIISILRLFFFAMGAFLGMFGIILGMIVLARLFVPASIVRGCIYGGAVSSDSTRCWRFLFARALAIHEKGRCF